MTDSQDMRPVPDPTVLTTEASNRLELMMRDLIKSEIGHQNDLFMERFARLEGQFSMLETRTAEQKKDTKDALDAALAAQKEAVASQTASSEKSITKSETATTERIKGVEAQQATSSKAMDDKITDLKDRVIAIEAVKLGNIETTTSLRAGGIDMRGNMASIMSVIMAVIAVASIIITIIVVVRP